VFLALGSAPRQPATVALFAPGSDGEDVSGATYNS
jgi:hypothetical protein